MKPLHFALALGLAAVACAPSHKQLRAMQERLSAMEAEQARLKAELDAVAAEQRRAASDLDQAEIERRRTRSVADDLAVRVAGLEGGERPGPQQPRPGRPDPSVHYKVLIGDAHVRGPDTALVTIVEWADFQCPFCGRVQETLDEVERKYEGRVRFVFKHNPLPMHDRAMAAAIAAEAAGRQGKFWQMHDLLFSDRRALTDAQFLKFAKKLRLDRRRFKRDLADRELKTKIEAQQKQGATLGARGTPAFFVNGRFLSGAQPIEAFSALIDEELASAQARVENGTRTTDVYDAIMAEAVPPAF
jgi:protein-disulfide isomerase